MGPHLIIPQQCQPNCGKQDERRRRQPARRCSKAKPVAQHESAGSGAKVRIAEEEASHVHATVHIERVAAVASKLDAQLVAFALTHLALSPVCRLTP